MSSPTQALEGTREQARRSPPGMARRPAGATMQALVYHAPGKRAWEQKPRYDTFGNAAHERALKLILANA